MDGFKILWLVKFNLVVYLLSGYVIFLVGKAWVNAEIIVGGCGEERLGYFFCSMKNSFYIVGIGS